MSKINYLKSIQNAIDYIEDNLQNDLSISQIAKASGYSKYHFLRLFRESVRLTPADYIRKRRISEIVRCMAHDTRPICDIAFEYGFNSKENFTRAFKSEHHILPTEYKASQNSLKLYDKVTFQAPDFDVKCDLMYIDTFKLIAYKSDESYPPNFWNKYNAKDYSKKLSGGKKVMDFGVSSWNAKENKLDYYIGIKETDALGDKENGITLKIDGGLYAVFQTPVSTHFNFINSIHSTWDYINTVWLPNSDYTWTGGYEFECYLEESRLFTETIYIPIKRRNYAD